MLCFTHTYHESWDPYLLQKHILTCILNQALKFSKIGYCSGKKEHLYYIGIIAGTHANEN